MGKLGAALEWARRGFPVFPLHENGKTPALEGSWLDVSTTDESVIRALWTDPVLGVERNFNVGVNTTGMCVVDIDVKNGKNGVTEYAELQGHYDTLVVQTPSGGYHCYFASPNLSNAALSDGIDIRSYHGFVVAPGSVVDGVAYQLVCDRPIAALPPHIAEHLTTAYQRTGEAFVLDTPAGVQGAINFLQTCPPAIEGARGDDVTFKTAARVVNEFALSDEVALNLLLEHYNPRCVPPWDYNDLLDKVSHARLYGTAAAGRLDPSIMFAGVNIEAPVLLESVSADWGNALDAGAIPKRPWLLDRVLMAGEVSMLVAPGSAGKSSVALAIAAHLAVGQDFGPFSLLGQGGRTLVYNGEDDLSEQSRRLLATCSLYGLDYATVKSQILMWSDADVRLKLVVAEGRTPQPNVGLIAELVRRVQDDDVKLLVLDPLVDIHGVQEEDNAHMNMVMGVARQIAREGNVAILLLHHTSKGGNARQEDRVGNMDIIRGASSIVYKSRIAFTLLNASQSDAEKYGFRDDERHLFVRLDDAKMNLSLADGKPTWFKRHGLKLPNGEIVGALGFTDIAPQENALGDRIASILIGTMTQTGQGQMTLTQAVAVLKVQEPLLAVRKDAEVKQRLEGMLAVEYNHAGSTLSIYRDPSKDRAQPLIVLT